MSLATNCLATRNQIIKNPDWNWNHFELCILPKDSDKFNFCYWIVNNNTFQLVGQPHLALYKPLNSFCFFWFSLLLAGESDLPDKIVLIFSILVQLWIRKNILSIIARNRYCFLYFYWSYSIIEVMA